MLSTRVRHIRTTPVRHVVDHASTAWLVDLNALGDRRWPLDAPPLLRRFLSFDTRDHLGDPERSWHSNVLAFARAQGVDLSHLQIIAATTARGLGYAFNPLTLYWCQDGEQTRYVIAEVHNTYGERHVYLLTPDGQGRTATDKQFYVSPFNDTTGQYRMSLPYPADGALDARITLHRHEQAPLVTRWSGTPTSGLGSALAAARAVFTPRTVWVLIRVHGIRLWAGRLPIVARPRHTPQEAA
ncbi:DUF1365 domain-containing protein [Dermacoccaceae bacterium W4C1]